MGENKIYKRTPADLVALATQMKTTLGSGSSNPYGIDPNAVSYLGQATTALATSNVDVTAKKAAYHGAVDNRLTAQGNVEGVVAEIARQVYANPAVSSTMIVALGLTPRSDSRAKIVPQTPTEVTASVRPNESILVRFKRNGNPQGVVFQIEAMVDGVWESAAITTAAKVELAGFSVGTAVAFRVVAQKNGQSAPPSASATAYGPMVSAPALRLAA